VTDAMNKKIIIAALLFAGGLAWSMHYFSDRQVIRRKFAAVAVSLAKSGEETPVMTAVKMRQVKDFIAPACEAVVPERNYQENLEPDLVIRYLIYYRARKVSLQVSIEEMEVQVPDEGGAEANLLIEINANQGRADAFRERHRVSFVLKKRDKNWLVAKATLPDALVSN